MGSCQIESINRQLVIQRRKAHTHVAHTVLLLKYVDRLRRMRVNCKGRQVHNSELDVRCAQMTTRSKGVDRLWCDGHREGRAGPSSWLTGRNL